MAATAAAATDFLYGIWIQRVHFNRLNLYRK